MNENCLFCNIVAGTIPAKEVLRTDDAVAFRDLNPQAPEHVLVVPTTHAAHLTEFSSIAEPAAAGRFLAAVAQVGSTLGPGGYRVVMNEGEDAGQTVHHLHAHVLAGRALGWPPG
jgi:histidine triad (HIT) family protein